MFDTKHKLRLKIIELEHSIESLKIGLKHSKQREEDANAKLSKIIDTNVERARQASNIIDFGNLDVFSIERLVDSRGVLYTSISTWDDDVKEGVHIKKCKEYAYYVSDDHHEQIIKNYIALKGENNES